MIQFQTRILGLGSGRGETASRILELHLHFWLIQPLFYFPSAKQGTLPAGTERSDYRKATVRSIMAEAGGVYVESFNNFAYAEREQDY